MYLLVTNPGCMTLNGVEEPVVAVRGPNPPFDAPEVCGVPAPALVRN